MGTAGIVWNIEKNRTWQKESKDENGNRCMRSGLRKFIISKKRSGSPTASTFGGTGILKSTSGKAEGPYVDVNPDGPMTDEIDASLFADDDGKVYFVWQNGKIARLKDDMTGLAEKPRHLKPANAEQVGFEGAFITKIDGKYYLICAEFNKTRKALTIAWQPTPISFTVLMATATSPSRTADTTCSSRTREGHGGRRSSAATIAPVPERAAILRIDFDNKGRIQPKM